MKGCWQQIYRLFYFGERFQNGKEAGHRNENDDTLWKTAAGYAFVAR